MNFLGLIVYTLILMGLGGAGFVFLFYRYQRETRQLKAQLTQLKSDRQDSIQQLDAVLHFTPNFVEAVSGKQIIEKVLQFSLQITGAVGASFVPLDDLGQPAGSFVKGEFPFPLPDAWLEYLASASLRYECQGCHQRETFVKTCPLLKGPFYDAVDLFCFPLHHAYKELGVLNHYLPDSGTRLRENQVVLQSLLDTTALALESKRLRRRESAVLSHLRSARTRDDLKGVLSSILEDLREVLEADYALLAFSYPIIENLGVESGSWLIKGILDPESQVELNPYLQDWQGFDEMHMMQQLPVGSANRGHVWTGAKIANRGTEAMGLLIVGNLKQHQFQPRHMELLQTTAGEIWRVIHDNRQMVEVEYKTLFGERMRLAREIHDGLAQTLGFLKLQLAQMQDYLDRNEEERLRQVMRTCYEALSNAYQDTREVIDTLRVQPEGEKSYQLQTWLRQLASYYEENPGNHPLAVILLDNTNHTPLPPEVHAQLIRIVQESLSNVRKHSRAKHVWISCKEVAGDFLLEIRDDGRGFSADDLPLPSQHGLRGMRERAELIGANFQVVSRPGDGAAISLRVPMAEWVGVEGLK
jgi:two-component system nitrate/nitrite sensor histidine kinase NarX